MSRKNNKSSNINKSSQRVYSLRKNNSTVIVRKKKKVASRASSLVDKISLNTKNDIHSKTKLIKKSSASNLDSSYSNKEDSQGVTDYKQFFIAPADCSEGESYRTPVVTLTIDADHVERRIDNFMISILPNIPKSTWYRLFRKGEIRVNKGRVKADYKLVLGDQVRVAPLHLINKNEPKLELEDIVKLNSIQQLKDSIVYEDQYLLIINKPSGIAVHGGSGLDFGVIEALRVLFPKEKRLELVHRIDKDTSGLLILAKRPSALKNLQEQFRNKTISKSYLCMTIGKGCSKKVNKPLLRYEKLGERFVKVDDLGKESITNFKVKAYYSDQNNRVFSLFEASPLTGRTHQIRVHALETFSALLGDSKYALDSDLNYVKKLGLNRLFLHAYKLNFIHPITDERINIEIPLPKELATFVNSLQELEN